MPWVEPSDKTPRPMTIKGRVEPMAERSQEPGPSNRMDQRRTVAASVDDNDDEDLSNDPVHIFTDRVTMAGLLEAHKAKARLDRMMFRVVILLSFVFISYQSYGIVTQYIRDKPIFDDFVLVNSSAPYPNISTCHHAYSLNYTLLKEWMKFSNQTRRLSMGKKDYLGNPMDEDYVVAYVESVSSWGMRWSDIGSPGYEVARHAFREASLQAEKEGRNVFDIYFVPCEKAISECSFYGEPFDCCDAFWSDLNSMQTCYYFDPRKLPRASLTGKDALLGLTFTIKTDWTVNHEAGYGGLNEGYDVYMNQIPSLVLAPTPIPSNMDVIIHLNEPIEIKERANCISEADTPRMKYFDFYDSLGTQCKHEILLDIQAKYMNCLLRMNGFYDPNMSCGLEQIYLIALGLDGQGSSSEPAAPAANGNSTGPAREETPAAPVVSIGTSGSSTAMEGLAADLFGTLARITGQHTPCKPLCTRWTYPVLSTSYNSIMYARDDLKPANLSWSRVTIIMPSSSKAHVEERRKASTYLALCDISGIMGVYLGFSMVTFVQAAVYGIAVLVWPRAETKIAPAAEVQQDGRSKIEANGRRGSKIGDTSMVKRRRSYVTWVIETDL